MRNGGCSNYFKKEGSMQQPDNSIVTEHDTKRTQTPSNSVTILSDDQRRRSDGCDQRGHCNRTENVDYWSARNTRHRHELRPGHRSYHITAAPGPTKHQLFSEPLAPSGRVSLDAHLLRLLL
ncbi:uncharacterized protein LOC132917338 [Rhopalosiphum padi]|uniref:uncharacterized protein LOC132917338 n=1 Tax=Rhopalosiphum padi TaxID=40932 RepID=UPI00298D60E3|nr:uncharacterized protein LOC132917338 [Rhopalosiphum padi]